MDLPSYLATMPDSQVAVKAPCPHCGGVLVGMYEHDTNSVYDIKCAGYIEVSRMGYFDKSKLEGCGWNEESLCPAECNPDTRIAHIQKWDLSI